MANSDLGRLLRSDEVQRVLKPKSLDRKRRVLKRNPLKNTRTLFKLNPYGVVQKRAALRTHLKLTKPVAVPAKTAAKPAPAAKKPAKK